LEVLGGPQGLKIGEGKDSATRRGGGYMRWGEWNPSKSGGLPENRPATSIEKKSKKPKGEGKGGFSR